MIELLKQKNHKIMDVSREITEALCPFDLTETEDDDITEKLQKLEEVSRKLTANLSRLSTKWKKRQFRNNPEVLLEKEVSCSQFSILQSDESENLIDSEDMINPLDTDSDAYDIKRSSIVENERPRVYRKRPLNDKMDQRSRIRRVADKRSEIEVWAQEEGVTVSELLGFLLYLENYHSGDREVAQAGWKIFSGNKINVVHRATLDEAVWMIERGSLSQSVYLEYRRRFIERFVLPPVMQVVGENKKHRPILEEYKHGVKASLQQCLRLTLCERLQEIDLSQLNSDVQINFRFNWGLDRISEHSNQH